MRADTFAATATELRPANEDRFSTLLLAAVTAVAVVAVAVTVAVAVAAVVLLVEVEALSSTLASPSAPSDPSSPSRLVALPSPLPCRMPSADPSGPDALSEVGAPRRGIGELKAGDKGLVLWGLASERFDWLVVVALDVVLVRLGAEEEEEELEEELVDSGRRFDESLAEATETAAEADATRVAIRVVPPDKAEVPLGKDLLPASTFDADMGAEAGGGGVPERRSSSTSLDAGSTAEASKSTLKRKASSCLGVTPKSSDSDGQTERQRKIR